ncbi:MAG: hypothetical protein Kow0074_19860 [Candidatus Zixiibacteriota bacterium]
MSGIVATTRAAFDALERGLNGKRIWLMSANVLVGGFLVFILNYPLMKITNITINGPDVWHDEALAIAQPIGDSNVFHYDFESVGATLQSVLGAQAHCEVRYVIPNGVEVEMTPTDPALWTDAGGGVRSDGALFTAHTDMPPSPVWRRSLSPRDLEPQTEARLAAGVWAEVLDGDSRFEQGVSEWMRDPDNGWVMIAADGRTRIVLGWNNLEERAASVARLLAVRDSTIVSGCTIDARFDGRLIVRRDTRTAAVHPAAATGRRDNGAMASRLPAINRRQGG